MFLMLNTIRKARQRQVALAAAVTYVTTKADWNCKNWRIK